MDRIRAAQLMAIERQCVERADECDRDCANCDLVQDRAELLEAYELAHNALIESAKLPAEWKRHNTYHGDDTSGYVDPDWRCSVCGKPALVNAWMMYDLTDFCPNCGAKMQPCKPED